MEIIILLMGITLTAIFVQHARERKALKAMTQAAGILRFYIKDNCKHVPSTVNHVMDYVGQIYADDNNLNGTNKHQTLRSVLKQSKRK